jgi:hypothetical protein
MQVDETKDRIFISNLDDELSDTDSSDEKLVLLPDIERRMTRIPKSVLHHNTTSPSPSNELVLYSIPSSLTVPQEEDSVRKAIIESRERSREKQAQVRPEDHDESDGRTKLATMGWTTGGRAQLNAVEVDDDPDAMDIG